MTATTASARDRRFDVVLFGATGFAGRFVAEYLAERYGDGDLRWALAGRNRERLEAVRSELARKWPKAASLELLVADSQDRASLDAITKDTAVVCTTVGPYARHGAHLVASCVDQGTHYVDLTGEVPFIRRMIDAHHDEAKARGVRIVCSCGFDSIPSDLGTYFLEEEAKRRTASPCDRVTLYVKAARGGLSGGTIASLLNVLDEARDRDVRRMLADPYALNPAGERGGPDGRDDMRPRFDIDIGAWTAPFFMAPINTRVVRRSNALLGYAYGRDFRYDERMRVGRGLKGRAAALGFVAGLGGFMGAASVPKLRRLLEKTVLPAPGEGPSRDKIEKGFFAIELVGHWSGSERAPVRVEVKAKGDPGYGATARMLAESALCLALDDARLESEGGVLTPAAAMGPVLIDRLQATDVTFRVL